jgi:hypothetical protein
MTGWIVYKYFPASKQRDFSDFLPISVLTAQMQKAGFCKIQVRQVHNRKVENLGEFLHYASQRFRTSQLIAIRDQAYEDGMAKIKSEIIKLGKDDSVPSEICLVWVTGDKPEGSQA